MSKNYQTPRCYLFSPNRTLFIRNPCYQPNNTCMPIVLPNRIISHHCPFLYSPPNLCHCPFCFISIFFSPADQAFSPHCPFSLCFFFASVPAEGLLCRHLSLFYSQHHTSPFFFHPNQSPQPLISSSPTLLLSPIRLLLFFSP